MCWLALLVGYEYCFKLRFGCLSISLFVAQGRPPAHPICFSGGRAQQMNVIMKVILGSYILGAGFIAFLSWPSLGHFL